MLFFPYNYKITCIEVKTCKIYIFLEQVFGHHLHKVSNQELVESFNNYVELYNAEHSKEIESGSLKALEPSSSEFIVKASGIQNRYVIEKESLLDPKRMKPMIQGKR